MKEKVMNGLEKFSKAMLSPLSYISAAGLILVLGALLTSTSLSSMIPVLQWTPIKLLGQLIYNCILVIINNLSLMFCVGIAAALAKKNKQQAAIIGLMSYFMYLTAGNVTLTQLGMLAEADPMVCLKSRKFSLFLQAQPDFALNSLEIHKRFLRLFALNPACACEIFVIFFVFRYTLRSWSGG